ncbi:MAG TPA: hypothetical protein VJL80_11010 [Aeromicrobium sp.]|nr:hypothetical protein [Aeromicrobium sp.]HKY58561.1 hypothetical protein [Aeromicrobium sp.]
MFRAGTRSALVASVVVAAAAVGVGVSVGGSAPAHGRGPLAAAMSSLPQSTTVAGFTDWSYVTQHRSLDMARERDLVTRSALIDVAPGLAAVLGVRLRDVRWEAYAKGEFGEAAVVELKRAMPTAARLRKAGYRPNKSTSVWSATGLLGAQEPLYASVAVLPKDGVLVLGSKPGAVATTASVVRGQSPAFVRDRGVADATAALAGVHTALIQARGLGCDATEPGREPETARQAEAAQQRYGRVERYSVLGRGLRDANTGTQRYFVAMTFQSAAVAAEQARTRGVLSQGPFIGRTGDMAEVLRLRSVDSDGRTARLVYDHPADSAYLMTGQDPLLPASC